MQILLVPGIVIITIMKDIIECSKMFAEANPKPAKFLHAVAEKKNFQLKVYNNW